MTNLLYILNHKTLTDFECPILIKNNIYPYIPKIYTSCSIENSINYKTLYFYDNLINIPYNIIKILNKTDFFSNNINDIKNIIDLINKYFNVIFITPLINKTIFNFLVNNFKGHIYFRFFGLDGNAYYYKKCLQIYGNNFLSSNVKFIFSYNEILDYEQQKYNYPSNSCFYIPLGTSNYFFINYSNIYNPIYNKIAFICSRIDDGNKSYYGNIYNKFLNDFKNYQFTILGKNNNCISNLQYVKNNLSDSDFYTELSKHKCLYYHSTEQRHLHYHPLEAMIIGMPVIFSSQSLLTSYIKHSPAIFNNIYEAQNIIDRILNNDTILINSIIEKQNEIIPKLLILNNNNIFSMLHDNLITNKNYDNPNINIISNKLHQIERLNKLEEPNNEIKLNEFCKIIEHQKFINLDENIKNRFKDILEECKINDKLNLPYTICSGLGDILMNKMYNLNYNEFNIYWNIKHLFDRRPFPESIKCIICIYELLKKIFKQNFKIFYSPTYNIIKSPNWKKFQLIPNYDLSSYFDVNLDQKYINMNINTNKYIIIHTKLAYQNNSTFLKNKLSDFFKNYKTNLPIIILGERNIHKNIDANNGNMTTIYNEALLLKKNNIVHDLTKDYLNDSLDINDLENDIKLINNAKINIGFSYGGHFCINLAFSKKSLFYIDKKSFETFNKSGIIINKNNFLITSNIDIFIYNCVDNTTSSKSRQIERWSKLREPNIEKLTCIICDYTDLYKKFQKLYANDLFNAGKLIRHKCSNCGLIFGDLRFLNLSPEELKYDYEDLYSYYKENFTLLILKLIKSIKLFENKKFSYLEYECKNKSIIDTLKKNGYNIYGFNKYINHPNILNVIENIKFDVIYVFNFVEHLINPITELQNILSYLNPNGYLIIMSDSLDEYKFEISHYKTYYYLGNSFNILCNKLNLNIISSQ